jgi:hypothetical protein
MLLVILFLRNKTNKKLFYDSLWEVFCQCHRPEDQLEEHEGQDEGYLALDRKAKCIYSM